MIDSCYKLVIQREVVVAQLAERSLMIPEDPGSNPVIGNFYLNIYLLLTVCRKDENKEKEAGNGDSFFYLPIFIS